MMGKLKGMLGREKKKEGDEADAVPADEEAKAGAPPSLAPVGGAAGIAAEADDEEDSPFFGKRVTKDSFDLVRVLGKGSFGKVMLVRKKDNSQLYAMKVLKKLNLVARRQVEHTRAERNILMRMAGVPFIVHVRYGFQTADKLYLVMDFMQGGELFFHLKKSGRFSQRAVQFYAAQMTLALEAVHKLDVVYRDLKPENVLLGKDGYICLTDFGLSKEGVKGDAEGADTFCGTPEYLAPEVLKEGDSTHGKAVDWWAMGTLLFEMLHGLPPFYSSNTSVMYEKIAKAELTFPKHITPVAQTFLTGLLQRLPEERFDASAIKAHPFFAGVDWEKVLTKQYEAPLKPRLSHDLDLSNFDRQFTKELPFDSVVEGSKLSGEVASDDLFDGFTYDQTLAESARLQAEEDDLDFRASTTEPDLDASPRTKPAATTPDDGLGL